jgi:hypothetical protein
MLLLFIPFVFFFSEYYYNTCFVFLQAEATGEEGGQAGENAEGQTSV